jgi:hypothetical protein
MHQRFGFFRLAVVLLIETHFCHAQQQVVFDVGNKSQLFIDHVLVREARGVSFTQHPARKHPQNPLLKADQPFEGWQVQLGGSVLYDEEERLFKMWYMCLRSAEFEREMTCYATSDDGIRWEKPPVGTVPARSGKPTNVVADCLLPSVFKDRRDPDSKRRYKMICYVYDRGYLSQVSPDGLHWHEEDGQRIVPISYVDDVITALWDERREQYVVFPKQMTPVLGRSRRSLYISTSRDFKHWSKLAPAFLADRRDDLGVLPRLEAVRPLLNFPVNLNVARSEFYGAGAFAAECGVVAFPWVFTVSANVPKFGNQDGPVEVQLAMSRDLETWSRPFRTPILPLGAGDVWDCGMVFTASQAIEVGDEIRLYYGATNYTHGAPGPNGAPEAGLESKHTGSIGLATWKRDRFVSADGPAEEGTLTTVPIKFQGRRLEINAVTRPKGSIVAEILGAGGQPIEQYAAADPFAGDELRHVVTFGGRSDVARLAGETISLRFRLRNAELYSFAFRD